MKATLCVVTNNIGGEDVESPSNLEPSTPKDETTMRSVLERDFIENVENDNQQCRHNIVTVAASVHKPSPNKDRKELLVRINACSLSMSNDTNLGKRKRQDEDTVLMDICGIIEEASESVDQSEMKIGDVVLATSISLDVGGVPEYVVIDAKSAVVQVPSQVDPVEAAACSDAAIALAMINHVRIGDRIMIVGGGSSSIGAAAIQLAKIAGAAYVATTTGSLVHQVKLTTKVDDIIAGDDWTEDPKYLEEKFDKIIDVTREQTCQVVKANKVLKTADEGGLLVHLPSYTHNSSNIEWLTRILNLLEEKKLSILLDPASPLPFSEEGVESAYELHMSGSARGRVVVQLS